MPPCRSTEQSISNALGALLVSSTFLAIVQCILVQPVMSSERAVMYRERAAGIYNVMAWYLGIVRSLPRLIWHQQVAVSSFQGWAPRGVHAR